MAGDKDDLDLASLDGNEKKGGMKKIILIAVAVLVLVGGGVGGAMFFMGGDEPAAEGDAEVAAEEVEEEIEEEDLPDPLYLPLDPPFVATANDPGSRRVMQIRMQAMSYDQEVIDSLKNNMALLRDAVIMLLSAQDFDTLGYPQEKQRLRGEIKQAIEDSVRLPKGKTLEAVLFTEFILE